MRPSPVLCTRSPTPATVLVAAHHAAPATCTPRDKQTRFSERNKDKRKTKQNYPGFEFKPHQVNDSSQSNQVTFQLVSHSLIVLRVVCVSGCCINHFLSIFFKKIFTMRNNIINCNLKMYHRFLNFPLNII
jgi:hypothetical protein